MDRDEAQDLDEQLRLLGRRPNLRPAFNAWVEAALAYSALRARWGLMSMSERAEHDARRTALHDVAINALNRLSRETLKSGETGEWRGVLGDDLRRVVRGMSGWELV